MNPDELILTTAEIISIAPWQITGIRRSTKKSYARYIIAHHLRNRYKYTTTNIAKVLNCHYTSVLYYLKKYEENLQYNSQFREITEKFNEKIK
ncbi:MAG: hypothetical protein PUB21_11890 [Bacteroidales bacterium]|nr:hypothetical protein [Bacteroidales bacterium]